MTQEPKTLAEARGYLSQEITVMKASIDTITSLISKPEFTKEDSADLHRLLSEHPVILGRVAVAHRAVRKYVFGLVPGESIPS